MSGGKSVKTLIILIACLVLGSGLEACSSKTKPGQTGLWARVRRNLMVATYSSTRGPAITVTTSTGTKLAAGETPAEGEPKPAKDETGTPPETTPSEGETATRGPLLVPTFGSTQTQEKIFTPEAVAPGFFAGLPRNIGGPNGGTKSIPQGNPPPHLPSTSLAGSPKIQMPGAGNGSAGSPTQTTASTPTTSTGPGSPGQTPTTPQGNGGAETPKLPTDTGLQIATRDTAPPEPGSTALEGTLGSTVESAILPSFDALYFTLPGQDLEYDKNSIRDLDFNIWAMSGPVQLYDNTATARFYTERTYTKSDPNLPNPIPEGCTTEEVSSDLVKMICKGPFGFINGHLLRVIACGTPNPTVLAPYVGNDAQKLAAFLARAWIQGDQAIWDQDLCPERRYLDYPFVGADARLTGVLEAGKIYFIVQFPIDYVGHEADYGAPIPVAPNMALEDLGTYNTSRDMNKFLFNGRIVQVVMGAYDAANPGADTGEYTNIPLGELFQVSRTGSASSEGVPPNEFCQGVSSWDANWTQFESALLEKINEARAQGTSCGNQGNFAATTPLYANATLRCAARVHSKDMNDGNFFAHLSATNGSSELVRIFTAGTQPPLPGTPGMENQTIAGTLFANGGENIARGPAEAAQVVQEWLASPGHCANMMNPAFTHLGAGYHSGSSQGPLWTLTLGSPWK